MHFKNILVETRCNESILIVTINRPEHRNAIDRETADELHDIFTEFDQNSVQKVAILTGSGGNFCAGTSTTDSNMKEPT